MTCQNHPISVAKVDTQANVSSSNCKLTAWIIFMTKLCIQKRYKRFPKSACLYIRLGTITERKVQMYNDMSLIYEFIFILYTGSIILICW